MMHDAWQYICAHSMAASTIVFSVVYLAAWFLNGYLAMHFSCSDLMMLYSAVVVKELGIHGINSACNSPKGEPPGAQK